MRSFFVTNFSIFGGQTAFYFEYKYLVAAQTEKDLSLCKANEYFWYAMVHCVANRKCFLSRFTQENTLTRLENLFGHREFHISLAPRILHFTSI